MSEELAPGPSRPGFLAALIGAVALIPSALLVAFGVLEVPMPAIISHPIVVLGGIALAILINVGSSIRCRVQADGEGVSVDRRGDHLHVPHRGKLRTPVIIPR